MRKATMFSVCSLLVVAAGVAFAQPSGDHKAGGAVKPADMKMQPAGGEKTGMPSQQECMAAMMEAGTPGPMHEWLVKGCGTWEGTCKMWETPDSKPTESKVTTVLSPMMDGKFVRNETKGEFDFGNGQKMPFEGFGICGFNNTTQKFEGTWMDSMGTMQMHSTGTLSEDKKTLTMESHYMCPIMKKDTFMREVHRHTGADTMVLEFYGPDMTGKNAEFKMMEISYTRKAGTAPKEMPKATMPGMPAAPMAPAEKKSEKSGH